jgi:hypothetical protein
MAMTFASPPGVHNFTSLTHCEQSEGVANDVGMTDLFCRNQELAHWRWSVEVDQKSNNALTMIAHEKSSHHSVDAGIACVDAGSIRQSRIGHSWFHRGKYRSPAL